MSLDRLVEEVRRLAAQEVEGERARFEETTRHLLEERAAALKAIQETSQTSTAQEAARIRSAGIARARVESRQLVFEARQRAAERTVADARRRLGEFAGSPEYPALLKELYGHAVGLLGKPLKLSGRAEDASLLKGLAGKGAAPPEEIPVLGGLVAATPDGRRRLDLSFDELLRRREDGVLALARGAGAPG